MNEVAGSRLQQPSPNLGCGEWWKAFDTCMDGFWLNDMTGRLVYVNDAYARQSGYSREELLSMSIRDVEAREDPEETAAHIEKILREGYDRFETVQRRKDGSLWSVEVAASYTPMGGGGLFAFFRDITERKNAERALRESEEFKRRIIASSADRIEVLDIAGNLLFMSDGGQRLLEIADLSRYLNADWVEFWRQDDRACAGDAIARARAGEVVHFQAFCPSEKGTPKWWDVQVTPILDADGTVDRLLAVSRDVTERKAFEDALEAARAEAERANNAKSRFFAAAGHDLRQPFQAMRLFFEVARQHMPGSAAEAFSRLGDAMRSGEELLSALLDISLLDVGMVKLDPQPFPVDDLLAPLAAECEPQASIKNLRLRHVPCGVSIISDQVMLARMIRNLLVNAIRYTEQGGVVVGCRRKGRDLMIMVCDSGIGIPDIHIKHVFEEFYQIGNGERDRAKGLGLGLSVVAKTARLLGHGVDVRSTPGGGSTFSVTVPVF